MIEVDPDKLATFGNGMLTAAVDLTATRLALAARAMAGGGLGAADPDSSFRDRLSTTTEEAAGLVADLVATFEVDGEALLLVAAENIQVNTNAAGTP